MRKFNDVYKDKQNRANELLEGRVLNEFKSLYSLLLDKYRVSDFYTLNEEEQVTFLSEINTYWNDQEGTTEKGKKFLQIRSDVLSEGSTSLQKKNYLKNKATTIISESIRQTNLKWKIYDIIDEMFNETQAKQISDILSPDNIVDIVKESLNSYVDNFINEIKKELNESAKETNKINEGKKDPKAEVRNRGTVIFPAGSKDVKDDKDHFPINNVEQGRNALARCEQYKSVPSWYKGTLAELKSKVKGAVKRKYSTIKVTE